MLRLGAHGYHGRGQAGALDRAAVPGPAAHDGAAGAHSHVPLARPLAVLRARVRLRPALVAPDLHSSLRITTVVPSKLNYVRIHEFL